MDPIETEMDPEAIMLDLLGECDDAGVDRVNRLRFVGFSRGDKPAEASPTDDRSVATLLTNGVPFFVRCIFNTKVDWQFTIWTPDNLDAGEVAAWLFEVDRSQVCLSLTEIVPSAEELASAREEYAKRVRRCNRLIRG